MVKLRIIIIALLLILSISLWGDTISSNSKGKQGTGYPLSKETVRIQGFSQYPNTVFYHIYAKSIQKITVYQISGDVITINPGMSKSMHYISWDTSLSALQHGVELSGEENPSIIQYLHLYRNDRKPQALEVPFYSPCRKISSINSYYMLQRHSQYSAQGGKEFGLNLYKRIYSGGSEQITLSSKFHEMQMIIEKLTHQQEKIPVFTLTKEEAKTIRAYTDSLKTIEVNRLYLFRKTPATNQDSEQIEDTLKPHGILKIKVSGFDDFQHERLHLLIVGGNGLTCRRIHGNNISLKLESDEDGYISRSRYWDREKKGVLFEAGSKQYTHFKATLRPKNRNEEALVEIPTYLISDDQTSGVIEFIAESQNPEMAKSKGEFVIRLKEKNRRDKSNYQLVLRQLFNEYPHLNKFNFAHWMQYLLYFLGIFLLSLIVKFPVLLVLFKPLCHASGWLNRKMILYACSVGIAISLFVTWWIFPLLIRQFAIHLILSFAISVVIEGIIYSKRLHITEMKAILLTIVCNLVFYSAGLMLFS